MLRSISIFMLCCVPAFAMDFDASTTQWDWIDMKGDGQIHTTEALNPPPGYGPKVLELDGDLILGLLKKERMDTGDMLVLYRELNARDRDADGILLFHADFGESVSVEHNTKIKRAQSWLEQDNDSGVHFRAIGEDGEERAFDEHPGMMLVTDAWNITGWIWQRVRITEDRVMGRVWPAHEAEPEDWHLDTERFSGDGRRFGLRVSSGAVQVAHFEASKKEIAQVEKLEPWIYFPNDELFVVEQIPMYAFNFEASTRIRELTVQWSNESDLGIFHVEHTKDGKRKNKGDLALGHLDIASSVGEEPLPLYVRLGEVQGRVNVTKNDALKNKIQQLHSTLNCMEDFPTVVQYLHKTGSARLAGFASKAFVSGDVHHAETLLQYAEESNARSMVAPVKDAERIHLFSRRYCVEKAGGQIDTKLTLHVPGAAWVEVAQSNGHTIRITPAKRQTRPFEFTLQPTMSYYTVRWEIGKTIHEQKIVGPVVNTKDSQLYVNGEPFIVKGVNVHALDSGNPERTRRMMKSLKGLGFNMLRGDYPPTWEVEMAEEENLFWTILAPFSVASTDEIKERQGGSLMGAAREITMEHILKYRDYSGTLLWNSCNEITGDTTAFLENLYPVYKHLDPYKRPVHYANLFGQERWQGQDAVGINYYFAKGQTPEDKHPLIQKSIDLAKAQNKPVFYTEYNSYQGPDPKGGVMAMAGLFEWGMDHGMSGGFFYMGPTSSDHPGVWTDAELNTDPRMAEAFHKAFDDVEVFAPSNPDVHWFFIRNKRPYILRDLSIVLNGSNTVELHDLSPNEIYRLPKNQYELTEKSFGISYESHYGIRSTYQVNIENLNPIPYPKKKQP